MESPDTATGFYSRIRPWLFRLDPEWAHAAGLLTATVAQRLVPRVLETAYAYGHGALGQRVFGLSFPNPIGLAAGFDKNGALLRFWEALGLGFVEIGSVTARASRGNRRPRMFRLAEEQALINRLGLPSIGAARVARRLISQRQRRKVPIGVNLAKTNNPGVMGTAAIEDYRLSFHALAPLADYVVLNISCPNTEDGLTFEDAEALDKLRHVLYTQRRLQGLSVPMLLKLAPPATPKVVFDSQVEEIIDVGLRHGVHGFVASNTSPDRHMLSHPEQGWKRMGPGGLSGGPLAPLSRRLVRYIYQRTGGKIPVIGVGGIDSAESAYAMLRSGASLVQIYTGLVYHGPRLVQSIKEGLVTLFERDGISSIRKVIGADA